MSCEIKPLSKIDNLKYIQEVFGFSQDENWLNAVYYSLSPTGELLVLGHGTKIVLLAARWDNEIQQNQYSITWKGDLDNPNDVITAIVCLPIIGASQTSTQSMPDWTCIAIGLSSGMVLFYTDSGLEIFSQQWHNEQVIAIKAQSGKRITEELHIFYCSCVCILQGTHLFQLLRSMKSHLQKYQSNKADLSPIQEQLPCRKWGYGGKNVTINDACVVGAQKVCAFDHLLTASMEGGFYAKYKSAPPQNALVIGVGVKPYVGFHWAKEGFVQPVLADVARAVASKIKSALPTWLTRSQASNAVDAPPAPIPSEPMTLRFGLCDIQRIGLSVCLAPGSEYAAVTDNLGRVCLIDCYRGVAVRVWKGYREAQCGFVKVNEKMSKQAANPFASNAPDRRHALFLIIFAPRRSCLEIWGLQRGKKVAAFTASKNGQLIYNSHSLMGVTNSSKVKYLTNTCLFLDPTDQSFKEITIPFHCALSDSNSKTAKDLHLLRRIKLCFRSGDGSEADIADEIAQCCRDLQTDEIRLQCIEMLVKNNKVKPTIFKAALAEFLDQTKDDEEEEKEREDENIGSVVENEENEQPEEITEIVLRNRLKAVATSYYKLVNFYIFATTTAPSVDNNSQPIDPDTDSSNLPMNISMSELENLQKFVDLAALEHNRPQSPKVVTFSEKTKSNAFIDYLSIFNCYVDDSAICLKDEKVSSFAAIGADLFGLFLENGKTLRRFLENATELGLASEDLMRLFLCYWLAKPFLYTKSEDLIVDLSRFTAIIQEICALAKDRVAYEYNSICMWWQQVREMLLESPSAQMSVLAAMMCRNHAANYRQRENSNDDSPQEDEVWEQYSQESAQWSLLIAKLDDIAVLGAILNSSKHLSCAGNATASACTLPTLNYEKPDVSLKTIVNSGKGIVSELVAKWISAAGIDPSVLLEKTTSEASADADESVEPVINKSFLNYIQILREHFPFSLQSGIILSQQTWEYFCHWSKNMSNLNLLKGGLRCLDTIRTTDYALKHGLCCMIWNAHLKIPLEATKKLVNKTGRLPKEKLCQQDIGLSDSLVPEFLEQCTIFLEHFSTSLKHEKMDLKYEELLQDGPIPLSLLTLQQNLAYPELLRLHKELNELLYVIASLAIKYQKPVQNLFDAMANQSFFAEINRDLPYVLPHPDMILQKRRSEFLCIAITSTMDLIREDMEGVYLNDHIVWMQRIEDLANQWSVDTTQLMKHQIVELYAHGWDDYGSEQLERILDTHSLGKLLLKIAARRLNIYTRDSPTAYAQVASIGPLVSDYLDTINDEANGSTHQMHRTSGDISLENLINLAGKAFKCLADKDSKELRIAGQLFDACTTLKETMYSDD